MVAGGTTELRSLLTSLSAAVSALEITMDAKNIRPFSHNDLYAHPLDEQLAEPLIWYARKAIVGLCYTMISLVQTPAEKATTDGLSFATGAALMVITDGEPSLADMVYEAGAEGVEIAKLGQRSGKDSIKLRSLFRILITIGYFRETSFGIVAATRSTLGILSASTVFGALKGVMTLCMGAATALLKTINLPAAIGETTPFEAAYQQTLYRYLAARPEELSAFQIGMTAAENGVDGGLISDYPWEALGSDITLVDIGAGNGAMTLELLLRNAGWKAVIVDTEDTIPLSRQYWQSKAPALVEAHRVTFLAHDLMEEIPLRPREDGSEYVFMLKTVLHNWPDDACLRIIQNLSPATRIGSILLIVNYTPQISQAESSAVSVAEYLSTVKGKTMPQISSMSLPLPAGLEAGWGYGNMLISCIDVSMLTLFSGRDRTVRDFEELLQGTGWKVDSQTSTRGLSSILRLVDVKSNVSDVAVR